MQEISELVLDIAELAKPINFAELFGREGRVEIEVGIGSGYFLSRHCKAICGLFDHRLLRPCIGNLFCCKHFLSVSLDPG